MRGELTGLVLAILKGVHPNGMTPKEIAEIAGCNEAAVMRHVVELEKEGRITISEEENGRRVFTYLE